MDGLIHGARSTNCISAVPVLNPLHSGMLKSSVSPLTISDSHLASVALLAEGHHGETADDGQPDQHRE